ncbi:2-oxoglutarate-Fe(II) type oxidoreductase hxnY-like isoform X4 [Abrus precatorius]|uniref:2-oxoglutarate-Fe(II) type oxidoreductase hxnY-like isoform X4 n=1 Tax=Abrus precatorius TaxID=3816 RepID=A0A8B8LQH3_ABRPR|nr:2-oxoglutarate-Fe(II) type oxidoreductase hxnY-like isoform X4 [Abrus precatorius]
MGKQSTQSSDTIKSSVLNCIDLSNPDISQSVNLLKQVCKKFFSLPQKEKMKVLRSEKHRGYTPVLDEILDPQNQVHGDYKEGYYIGVEVVLPRWRDTMEKFHREALEVGRAVAKIIALALGLDAKFFDQPKMLGEPIATLRLLHYGVQISDPSKGLYGAGAHTDFGLITLLATDEVSGLQICKDRDAKPQIWEDVAPLRGAFIVNLGDMLERWSNCVFKSTLHRVLGNGQERYSIAYFLEPSYDCLVECLPTCKSNNNPPKFPPILCGDYMTQRYNDTHADLKIYKKQQA